MGILLLITLTYIHIVSTPVATMCYLCGMDTYIAYYRVSTTMQGKSGLGLEGQAASVKAYTHNSNVIASYTDIETGKNDTRPELLKAIQHANMAQCVLLVASLDRLSRNVTFISILIDKKVRFICCDMPDANELTIHIMAAIAQGERKAISKRTKVALQALKDRGIVLGKPGNFNDEGRAKGRAALTVKAANNENNQRAYAFINMLRTQGHTLAYIALSLNTNGFKTSRGKCFAIEQVRRLIA